MYDLPSAPSADYTIYYLSDGLFKIVRHNFHSHKEKKYHVQRDSSFTKFQNSYSRAFSNCLDLLLSNEFAFFWTGTISPKKADRFDLDFLRKKITQFFRDQRKKYHSKIPYLIIPEEHKKGGIHFHGVITLPYEALCSFGKDSPLDLQQGEYYNWPDYQKAFGFCSLSPIRDRKATAFYMTKYLCKDQNFRLFDKGGHLYYCSQDLNRKSFICFVYGENDALESLIDFNGKYCGTGIAHLPFIDAFEIGEIKYEEIPYFDTLLGFDLAEFSASG